MLTRSMQGPARCRALAVVAGVACGLAFVMSASADGYDPPVNYYSAATGTGTTLKAQLRTLMGVGFISRSYGDARYGLPVIDRDPNNANNVILVYNSVSVPSTWDAGITWNREHTWPESYGNTSTSAPQYSDLHMLRPCNPSVNSSRGNEPFGLDNSSQWDPTMAGSTIQYRGEMARAMFYAATRYGDASGSITSGNFLLTDSGWGTGISKMGKLSYLLTWHFAYPVDERERLRNQRVFDQALNPTYYQNNRNAYVDHPEYVWAIWGTQANNSTIYVGGAPAADGSSLLNVDLGTVIVGAPITNQNVTVNKSGSTPTTFDITASGAATSANAVPRQAFVYNPQSKVISVGVTGAVSPGAYSGTLVINNTDLTSAGTGQGVADANDTVSVTSSVLAHSNASFDGGSDQNTLTVDLGRFRGGTGLHTQAIAVHNLVSVAGFTASLDLDSVGGSGDTGACGTNLTPTSGIAAGSSQSADVWLDTSALVGAYTAVYTIAVSDQNLSGATAGPSLTLTVLGEVVCPSDFNLDGFVSGEDFDGFVAAFELGDPAADFNNDTFVSGEDFDGFVAAFEGGC